MGAVVRATYVFLFDKKGVCMRMLKFSLGSAIVACSLFLGCGEDSSSIVLRKYLLQIRDFSVHLRLWILCLHLRGAACFRE